MIASDLNNRDFVGAISNPDQLLNVRFESRKYEIKHKSIKEGHPVYEMRDFIIIQVPGDKLNIRNTLVTEDHKKRFPMQWAHYQNTKENIEINGWDLGSWILNPAQVEELKYYKVFTVEQFADMPLSNVQKLGMGYIELQAKAKLALNNTKNSALVLEQADKIKQQELEIERMKQMQASLSEKLEKLLPKDDSPKKAKKDLTE